VNLYRRFVWRRGGDHVAASVESRDGRRLTVRFSDEVTVVDFSRLPDGRSSVIFPSGRQLTGRAIARSGGRVEAWVAARRVHVDLADPLQDLAAESNRSSAGAQEIYAQIPGRIVEVRVSDGDRIDAGTTLLVLEAMKMQNEIRADGPGRVTKVECSAGQTVETGALLVRVEGDPVS
jgi:biotin carboxyl carrier protein